MNRKRKIIKRIYYPSGLISILFLPILCIWFFNEIEAFKEYRIISARFSPNNKSMHTFFMPTEIAASRDFMYFTLTGNNKEDKQKLKQARVKIRELVLSKDTTIGVSFKFYDRAEFWTYIKAIEICKTENAKLFVPDESDIWIYNLAPKKQKVENAWTFGCNIIGTIDSVSLASYLQEQKDLKRQERIKEAKGFIKNYYISILLFLLMVFLSIKRIIKNSMTVNAK